MRHSAKLAPVCALLSPPVLPGRAAAATTASVLPSVSVALGYDDNPTISPDGGPGAAVVEVGPRLGASVRAPTGRVDVRGGIDAEAWGPPLGSLTSPTAREFGSVAIVATPTRRWSLAGRADVVDSATSRDVDLGTGLVSGRARARSFGTGLSFSYLATRRTTIGAAHRFTHESLSGQSRAADFHEEEANVVRRWTRRLTFGATALARQIRVSSSWTASWTPMADLAYALGASTEARLRAGPRFGARGAEDVEGAASVHWTGSAADIEASLARAETLLPGRAGALVTDSLAAHARFTLSSGFAATIAPAAFRNRSPSLDADALRIDTELSWDASAFARVFVRQGLVWQDVRAESGGGAASERIILLGVLFGTPEALEDAR